MQYIRHSSKALRPITLTLFPDAKLILIRASTPHNEEMIDLALRTLHTSNPGTRLLRVDAGHAEFRDGHHQRSVPIRLLDQAHMHSRLLVFPPHEVLGHVALQLLSQGIPLDALNTIPISRQRHSRIGSHDLLIVLPNKDSAEGSSPCLH